MAKEKKYYSLREGGRETSVFTGNAPRAAALKAARRGHANIRLREHGRKKDGKWRVHVFKGSRKKVPAPANAPDWMPAMINKANVSKLRVEKLDEI